MKKVRSSNIYSSEPIENFNNQNIIWVNEFDDHALAKFYAQFSELEANPLIQVIPIFISSYGGDTTGYFAMRDLIKTSDKPVATVGLGKAMSCGALLLAAGTKGLRFASEDTELMIHELSSGVQGKTTDIVGYSEDMNRVNKMVFRNLAKDTGTPVDLIFSHMHKRKNADWFFSAKTAKELGIIDHIGIPRPLQQHPIQTMQIVDAYKPPKSKMLKKA